MPQDRSFQKPTLNASQGRRFKKKKKSSGGKEASSERFPVHNFSRPLFIQESVLYRVCFGSLQPTKLRIQIQNPCRAQNQVVRPSFMKEERHIKNSNSKSSHGARDIPQWYGAHPAFGRPWIPSPVLRTTTTKKKIALPCTVATQSL